MILTKNASFRSYSTFAYLLRAHICNINMLGGRYRYITSARGHELSGLVHVFAQTLIIIMPGLNALGLQSNTT